MARHTTIDSNDVIVTSDDGTDGARGTDGPSGGPGGAGSDSLDVRARAPAGSFLLGPSGTWTVQAISGNGGNGGDGGTAAALDGGAGGDGSDSGSATAILAGLTDSSFAVNQTVVIDVSATSGAAGSGGSGGAGGADLGALAGADGADGNAGAASVIARGLHFTGITTLTLSLAASGGAGGHGTSAGGDAIIAVSNAKFAMAGSQSVLLIEADATGGSGGVSGGTNGGATIAMTSVAVRCHTGFNAIEIVLNAEGGDNGVTPAGARSIDFSGNEFAGHRGSADVLSFSSFDDDSLATHDDLTIDMRQGTITLHDAGHGDSTSTFHNFFVAFGGAGDDVIVGVKTSFLGGGQGADTLTGGSRESAFVYEAASDSFGAAHDTITNLDVKHTVFEVPFAVNAVDKSVQHADLSAVTLDGDLANTLPALQSHHAVLVSATAGDLDGHVFLVIDADGTVGYQANADMVVDVTGGSHLGFLATSNFLDIG